MMSRSSAISQCSLGLKSNLRFSPFSYTTTLSFSSLPMGTDSWGMLGMLRMQSFLMSSSSAILSSLALTLSATSRISAILASFSSPLGILEISWETVFLTFLRRLFSLVRDLHSASASRNLSRMASSLFLFLSIVLILSGSSLITLTSSIVNQLGISSGRATSRCACRSAL